MMKLKSKEDKILWILQESFWKLIGLRGDLQPERSCITKQFTKKKTI